MADSLSDKISKLKDEDAAEKHGQLVSYQDEQAKAAAYFTLGRIKQNDHIAQAIATNLSSQSIRALERFFAEKGHEALGHSSLVDFLDKSEYAPMTKRQYYDRLSLVREHGDEIYDLMTSVGISVRSQKLLGKGELSIKDDTLYIGDKEVEVGNTGIIKDVLNELFDEKRQLLTDNVKYAALIEKLETQVKTGTDEFNQLQRAVDAINERTPYERALLGVVQAMLTLGTAIADLTVDERTERGPSDLKTIAGQYFLCRDAYGVNVPLAEHAAQPTTDDGQPTTDFDAKIAAAIAEPDDLDDEEDPD